MYLVNMGITDAVYRCVIRCRLTIIYVVTSLSLRFAVSPVTVVGDVDTSHHRCAQLSSRLLTLRPTVVCLRFTLSRLLTLRPPVVCLRFTLSSRLLTLRPTVVCLRFTLSSRLLTLRPTVICLRFTLSSRLLTLRPRCLHVFYMISVILHVCVVTRSRCAPDVFTSSK